MLTTTCKLIIHFKRVSIFDKTIFRDWFKKNWKEKEHEAGQRIDRKEEQQLKLNRIKNIKYEKEEENGM